LIEKAEQREIGKKKSKDREKEKSRLAVQSSQMSAEAQRSLQALTESKWYSFEDKTTNRRYM